MATRNFLAAVRPRPVRRADLRAAAAAWRRRGVQISARHHVDYIKRIVGLPGDHIQVKQGQLYINGEEVPRQPAGDYVTDDSGIHMVLRRYLETLPGGVEHYILKATDEGEMNNTPEYVVPPDHVFAMGDNRDNSADSRFMNASGSFRWRTWSATRNSCSSRWMPTIPGGKSGSGRSRSAGAG